MAVKKSKSSATKTKTKPVKKSSSIKTFTDKITNPINNLINKTKEKLNTTKVKTAAITTLVLALIISIFLIIVRDKFLVRTPLLVMQNPVITFIYGEVQIRSGSDSEWEKAIVGDTLKEDMELKTEKRARADLAFNSNTAIRISPNSHFILKKSTIKNVEMQLDEGSIFGKFQKLFEEQNISVKTPTATAAVRGTELGFEVTEISHEIVSDIDPKNKKKKKITESEKRKATIIYALSGITEVFNPAVSEEKILLSYQNKTTVEAGSPPSDPESMSTAEVSGIRKVLNSIHSEKVLLVSNKILFETGSADLLQTSFKELDSVVEILKKNNTKIRIVGHTDDVGSAHINQVLSVKRAFSVKDYLVQKGVSAKRLFAAGYGSSMPISDNETEQGKAENRRVEFIIVE